MNFWLFTLIGRIIAGEPLEKSTKADVQLWGSAFASMPLFMIIGIFALKPIDSSAARIIWVAMTILASAYFFLWLLVLRRLPVWLIALIAVIAWTAFAVISWSI